jgi:DNA-binding transcriptional LysR family regulator
VLIAVAVDAHLRDLRYFVAVAEDLNFTRAAERLHVSQPSVSRQIRLLERDLGFALFRRDRRSVVLTEAGDALLPRARELLGEWAQAMQDAERRARAAAGVLRVGFQTSVAGWLYPTAVKIFTNAHADWDVELRLHPWSDPTAGLLDQTSDVAFLWLPVPGQDQIAHKTLRTEPRYVAMCHDHPLASRDELKFAELLDEPFIALPPSAGVLRDYWLAMDARNDHPVRIGAQVESPDETFEAVAARQGIVMLSEGNAKLYTRPGITARPVIDLTPAELAVAWRASDSREPIRGFCEAAQQAVATCPAPQGQRPDQPASANPATASSRLKSGPSCARERARR